MRIPLTLSTDYVPDWAVVEGLRELIANAIDAGSASFTFRGDTAILENHGADIERDALLLGVTSKGDGSASIGHFGEGMKLGVLALLRCGKAVRIVGRSETWRARLEEHETFPGRSVLVFHTRTNRESKDGVTVEVSGITREEWEQAKDLFLVFAQPKDVLDTSSYGRLLKDPGLRGRVYVKGVLVQTRPELSYGYDLSGVKTDRDRRMVSHWDAQWATSYILRDCAKIPESGIDFLRIIEEGDAWETANLQYIGASTCEALVLEFLTKYGDDAYPVANMAEATDLAHYGVRGIPVPKDMLATLLKGGLNAEEAKRKACETPKRVLALQDLTIPERSALQWAILRIEAAGVADVLTRIRVVEFSADNLLGLYHAGNIDISRKVLADRAECLATLIHEFAHDNGGDGDKNHVASIEHLWTLVVRNMKG